MNSDHPIIRVLLLSFMMLSHSQVTIADDDYIEAKRLYDSGEILSLEVILKNVRQKFPGKVLEVELEKEDGQIVYEIEILNDNGVITEIYVDAKTGKLLLTKEDD